MVEEASLESRLSKIDETTNHLLDEIKHNHLMSEKYKKICKYLTAYSSFNNYWLRFNFCICFISSCSCWY